MQHDLSFISKSNLKWLRDRTIFLSVHGSHAYGTNIETSDIDYKGIAIPPKNYFFGFKDHFEQAEFHEPDCVIFDIRKFFNLAIQCNPNVLEILFTEPEDHIIVHPIMKKILDNKKAFLSKKIKFTTMGYAYSQMKRMKLHYRWLHNPVEEQPKRSDFGLPEHTVIPRDQYEAAKAIIEKKLDKWNPDFSMLDPALKIDIENKITEILTDITTASIYLDKEALWQEAAISCGLDKNFILLIQKEKEYEAKAKEWKAYQEWKINRNKQRAELEKKHGYDLKHALHLTRLARVCKEVLTTGELKVKRPDKDELLAIRNGAFTYEELIKMFDKLSEENDKLYHISTLQHTSDINYINSLCIEIVEEFNGR